MLKEALSLAEMHRQQGRQGFALGMLSGCLLQAVSQVVSSSADANASLCMLHDLGIGKGLQEFGEMNRWALKNLNAGRMESAVVNEPLFLCLAWFCADDQCAQVMIDVLRSAKVQKHFPLPPFWRALGDGMLQLSIGQPYDVPVLKPKGFQRHLTPYFALISDLSHRRDMTTTLIEVERAFDLRNQDKRLIDWRSIDGDGKKPVRWDFRREALLRYRVSPTAEVAK